VYTVLVGELQGKRLPGRTRLHGEDKMKMYFKKYDVRVWTGFIWLKIGTNGGIF
jgi:hypothetical protein